MIVFYYYYFDNRNVLLSTYKSLQNRTSYFMVSCTESAHKVHQGHSKLPEIKKRKSYQTNLQIEGA